MGSIHQLVEAAAWSHPTSIAVDYDNTGETLTYTELNERADALAQQLCAVLLTSGGSTRLVAINTERSLAMIVGLLGIFKAGAAYVPIDPLYPQERQSYIINDSRAAILITDVNTQISVPTSPNLNVIRLDKSGLAQAESQNSSKSTTLTLATRNQSADRTTLSSSSLAYVLYTSGSTGIPKGVMVEHGNVTNMLDHFRMNLHVSANSSILAVTTFCFDISVLEMFLPLTSGAKLV